MAILNPYNGDEDVPSLQEFVQDLESDARAALYSALGDALQRLNDMPITDPRPGPGDALKAEIIEDHLEQEREVGE